jgi:hypothetical protein
MDKPELLAMGERPDRGLAPMAGRRILHLLHAAAQLSGREIHP